jgi:hypothetical protein
LLNAITERRSFQVEFAYNDLGGRDGLRTMLFIHYDQSGNQWRVHQVQVFELGSDTPFVGADG